MTSFPFEGGGMWLSSVSTCLSPSRCYRLCPAGKLLTSWRRSQSARPRSSASRGTSSHKHLSTRRTTRFCLSRFSRDDDGIVFVFVRSQWDFRGGDGGSHPVLCVSRISPPIRRCHQGALQGLQTGKCVSTEQHTCLNWTFSLVSSLCGCALRCAGQTTWESCCPSLKHIALPWWCAALPKVTALSLVICLECRAERLESIERAETQITQLHKARPY